MNTRSLNPSLRPEPTSLPAANCDPASGVLFTSLTTEQQTRALGRRRRDCGRSVSQHLGKINKSQTLTPDWNLHDSLLIAIEVKEFPQLLARQRTVLQLCNASNQIIISCKVEVVRLYVMSPPLPAERNPAEGFAAALYCRFCNKQTTVALKHLVEHFPSSWGWLISWK